MNYLIKGGRVIDPANSLDDTLDILVSGKTIVQVGKGLQDSSAEVIDATGKIVCPGFVDIHTHLREPGYTQHETIATATRAAAMGGFTSVTAMPNTNPVTDRGYVVDMVRKKAASDGVVNVFIMGALTAGLKSEETAHLYELDKAGVIGFGDDKPQGTAAVLRAAFTYARPLGKTICVHCEDLSLVADGYMHEGVISTVLGLNGRPRSAEDIEVARAIILAEEVGVKLHILHVSSGKAVRIIGEAKARGLNVTAEVTPHHLILTDEAVMGFNTSVKVTPPIRELSDREALREGLADGTIDCIATDHAPRCIEEKQIEFPLAGNGMLGLETAFGLLNTELVEPGLFDIKDIIAAMTVKPSQIYGLCKGTLSKGQEADITVIDPGLEWTVTPENLQSKSKNTPFAGKVLKGAPILTMVGGKVVMKGRQIVE